MLEALKANTEALKALSEEVKNLIVSAATKEELKEEISTINKQSYTHTTMKGDLITEACKFISDVSIAGYCDTSSLRDEIKAMVNQAVVANSPSSLFTEGELRALVIKSDFQALGDLY